ncbi:CPBP family intramembrane glutamic endopeptidase [Tropicimonas aquimaris]|uniref:CPBP family intramembrane glutamic endopeptidase n=1 Tax=Tropicimonas aquimaris TaxID=914152 RepID=A0ABW3IXY0_9RHOB
MRASAFEASLAEARDYPQLWRLGLGLVFIAFMYVAIVIPITVGAIFIRARQIAAPEDPTPLHLVSALGSLQAELTGATGIATPESVFFVLATFLGLFVGPLLAAAAFHFRGPGSLFGDLPEWTEGFLTALAMLVPVYAVMIGLGFLVDAPVPGLPLAEWLRFLPFALVMIFIQIGAEELVFRGYLQQQLAARFAARWIWMGLPAVLFAALHWSPVAGANMPLVLLSALVFGLLAADLTEKTGSLGAAMGLHFGNNAVGILGVATANTITGLALYVTAEPISAGGAQTLSIVVSIAVLVLVWWLTRRRLTR